MPADRPAQGEGLRRWDAWFAPECGYLTTVERRSFCQCGAFHHLKPLTVAPEQAVRREALREVVERAQEIEAFFVDSGALDRGISDRLAREFLASEPAEAADVSALLADLEALRERAEKAERELNICEKCGHMQAEPNWCQKCGTRLVLAPWAARFLSRIEVEKSELKEERDRLWGELLGHHPAAVHCSDEECEHPACALVGGRWYCLLHLKRRVESLEEQVRGK